MLISPHKVELSIEEWDCYDNSSCRTPQDVIDIINQEFSVILDTTHSPRYAQARIYKFLSKYSEYGFSDSECSQVATNVINLYYQSNIDRWAFLSITLNNA